VVGERVQLAAPPTLEARPVLHVLPHRKPGEERVLLEDHAALGTRAADRLAVDAQCARRWSNESGDRIEQRRFAAPGRPEQAHELAVVDVELHVVHGDKIAVAHAKIADLYLGVLGLRLLHQVRVSWHVDASANAS
jgi:hypothetical protein